MSAEFVVVDVVVVVVVVVVQCLTLKTFLSLCELQIVFKWLSVKSSPWVT